jgi:hypothetical protein
MPISFIEATAKGDIDNCKIKQQKQFISSGQLMARAYLMMMMMT